MPSTYRINTIYGAVQGEGYMTGTPMVVVRLHGCHVGCPWCDTRESWEPNPEHEVDTLHEAIGTNPLWVQLTSHSITTYIRHTFPQYTWALITGGEPGEQDLEELTLDLRQAYRIAVETSGTAPGVVGCRIDWLCVSPKITVREAPPVLQDVIDIADELKFVIGRRSDLDHVHDFLSRYTMKRGQPVISLQPMSGNKIATAVCVDAVKEYGWNLSIQIHRLLGYP